MTKQEAEIIVKLAHNQLSCSRVAKQTNYHRNTIYYHVKNIRKETGLEPYDFFDMQKLYPMAQEVLSQ